LILGAIRVQSQSRRLKSRYRPPDRSTIKPLQGRSTCTQRE
jgi:hypothetical protein